MEQKAGQSPPLQKTTANRSLLFLIIGFTSIIPLLFVSVFLAAWVMLPLPLVILAFLIFMTRKETRISEAKPRWLEIFLATLGAFYPPVAMSIGLWLLWWAFYGLAVLFGAEGELYGDAYNFTTVLFGLLLLVFAVFLVRMNWRHLLNQLYPQVGAQSAFAQISATGKRWLIKRGIIISGIFLIVLFVYLIFFSNRWQVSDNLTIENLFLIGLFFILFYLFFTSISAWLWLRKPEIPRSIEFTNKTITRLLRPLGYEVQALTEIKRDSTQKAGISEQMTASVDLVARKEDRSLVIDVMTAEETHQAPDWVIASEFRMAVWYLKNILQLPSPVEAVAVLVDVVADESLFRFAEDQNIKVIQLTGDEVVDLVRANVNDQAFQKKVISLFSPSVVGSENEPSLPSNGQVLEDGGRHG